jgi:hypothetical protein
VQKQLLNLSLKSWISYNCFQFGTVGQKQDGFEPRNYRQTQQFQTVGSESIFTAAPLPFESKDVGESVLPLASEGSNFQGRRHVMPC